MGKNALIKLYRPIERIVFQFHILCDAIGYALKSFRLVSKGQYPKYEILQLAHRLEKGLLNNDPKPMWGWEKAHRIAYLMSKNNDEFSNRTGRAVLKAYILAKRESVIAEEREKARLFEQEYPEINNECTLGGTIILSKADVSNEQKDIIEHFFHTRHSCRDFRKEMVSKNDIENAISLALRCPSACNRQVTNCYVYQSKEFQTIILTSSIRAYETGEFNDWFISPAIFAGYLSLTLHLYGIGSCIYRKQLYGHHQYNEEMRKKFNIPDDEMIILELRFGYYPEQFDVAVSNRHNANEITTFTTE